MSSLDPVQIAALQFAEGKPGVGFFLEQGLGKSLVALTEFSFLYDAGKVDRMIVVCPEHIQTRMAGRGREARVPARRPCLAVEQEGRRGRLAERRP